MPRGKQPRPPAKVPKSLLSGQGSGGAQTARRLVECPCADNVTGLKQSTEAAD